MIPLLLVGCGLGVQAPPDEAPAGGHAGHEHHHESLAPTAAAEGSLYALDLDLVTASGEEAALGVHRGHPVLLSMVYASCLDVCPATITALKGIEQRLPAEQQQRLRVLLVSLDPARDTVEALAALHERHGLDGRWTIARVPEEQVRELAAAIGIRYRHRPDGTIDHSAVVTLLDEEGVVEARMESLGQSPEPLIRALTAR